MKMSIHKYLFFIIIVASFIAGCRGDRGPVGPEGPQGPQGPSILPTSFEFAADLTQDNLFEHFEGIPGEIDIIFSDVLLVYVLEDFIEDENLDVWRQLPLTDFTESGTRLLNFDFTEIDLRLFLDADYQLGSGDEFIDDIYRAVHIPADFVEQVGVENLKSAATYKELQGLLKLEIIHHAD